MGPSVTPLLWRFMTWHYVCPWSDAVSSQKRSVGKEHIFWLKHRCSEGIGGWQVVQVRHNLVGLPRESADWWRSRIRGQLGRKRLRKEVSCFSPYSCSISMRHLSSEVAVFRYSRASFISDNFRAACQLASIYPILQLLTHPYSWQPRGKLHRIFDFPKKRITNTYEQSNNYNITHHTHKIKSRK